MAKGLARKTILAPASSSLCLTTLHNPLLHATVGTPEQTSYIRINTLRLDD